MKTVPQLAAELKLTRNSVNVRIRRLWPNAEDRPKMVAGSFQLTEVQAAAIARMKPAKPGPKGGKR